MNTFIREVAVFTCVLVLAGFITDWIKAVIAKLRSSKFRFWLNSFRACPLCGRAFRPKIDTALATATGYCARCMKSISHE